MPYKIYGDVQIGRSLGLTPLTVTQRNSVFSGFGLGDKGVLIEVSDGPNPGLQRWTGSLWSPMAAPPSQNLVDAPTITWDASVGPYGFVTVAGDRTFSDPSNQADGQLFTLKVTADATPRTVSFGPAFRASDFAQLASSIIPAGETRTWALISNGVQLIDVSHASSTAIASQALTLGVSVTWDAALGSQGNLSIASAIDPQMAVPTNIQAGRFYILTASNTSGGTRTLSFSATYQEFDGAVLAPDSLTSLAKRTFVFYSPDGLSLVKVGGGGTSVTMTASTNLASSVGGLTPNSLAAQQDLVLHGDATWRELFPSWNGAIFYSTGATIFEGGQLWKRIAAGNALGILFDAAEKAQWTVLSVTAGMTAATLLGPGTTGLAPAPVAGDISLFLRGDATFAGVANDFVGGTDYSAGSLVFINTLTAVDGVAGLYRRNTDGTGALAWSADVFNWTKVSSISDAQEQFVVPTIVARDAIATATTGDIAYVVDASADVTVTLGAALYVYDGLAWKKIAEFESLDLVAMTAAADAAAGASGLVPQPVAGDQHLFLRGDATFSELAPAWAAATLYSVGALVVADSGLWKRVTPNVASGVAFDATEQLAWMLVVSSKTMTGATFAVAGIGGPVAAPAGGDDRKVLHGDGTWGLPGVLPVGSFSDPTTSEAAPTGNGLAIVFVSTATGVGSVTGFAFTVGNIYTSNDATWLETVPVDGQVVYDQVRNGLYAFDGTAWVATHLVPVAQTLTDAATIAWDTALGQHAFVNITAARAIGAPTNLAAGRTYTLRVGSTGNFDLSFDPAYKRGDGFGMTGVGLSSTQEMIFEFLSTDGLTLTELRRPSVGVEDSVTPVRNYGPGTLVVDRDRGSMKIANSVGSFLSVLEGSGFQSLTRKLFTDTAIASWNIGSGSLHLLWDEGTDTNRVMTAVTGIDVDLGKPIVLELKNTGTATVSFTLPADFLDASGSPVGATSVLAGEEKFLVFITQGAPGSRKLRQMYPAPVVVPAASAWAPTTTYLVDALVTTPAGALVKRSVAGASGIAFNTAEAANWVLVQNGPALPAFTSATWIYADQILLEGTRAWLRTASGVTGALFNAAERATWTEVTASELIMAAPTAVAATAVFGEMLPVDSRLGVIVITPPASPNPGDRFGVVDSTFSSSLNSITIDFVTAGVNVFSLNNPTAAANLVLNVPGAIATCTYVDATIGYIIQR